MMEKTGEKRERSFDGGGSPSSGFGSYFRLERARPWLLMVAIFGTATLVAGLTLADGRVGFQVTDDGATAIQDFAAHLQFSRSVWSGAAGDVTTGSAYSVEAHQQIMTAWMGDRISKALPFGYSPVMLLLLLPLCFLPARIAYLLWTGAGVLSWSGMILHPRFSRLFGLAFFLTPIALGTVSLGQTGLLGAAAVFFLAQRALSDEQCGGGFHSWLSRENLLSSMVLLALASKPPLAVVAGIGLLATAKYRPVILSLGLVGVTSLALAPILGSGWPRDYLALIGSYDLEGASSAFSWSFHPEHMSNLRSFLSVDLGVGDGIASKMSNIGWALASLAVLLAGGYRRIQPSEAWALSVLAYLLLCSHVSSTDEVLLATVPAFIFPAIGSPSSVRKLVFWTLPAAGLLLSPAFGLASGTRPSFLWLTELAMAGWILMNIYGREKGIDGSQERAKPQEKDGGQVFAHSVKRSGASRRI